MSFLLSNSGQACIRDSRPYEEILAENVQGASAIYVARLISSNQEKLSADGQILVIKERSRFQIEQVIKGEDQTDMIEFSMLIDAEKTKCSGGAISAVNIPPWKEMPPNSKMLSIVWILYIDREFPNELRFPSRPIDEENLKDEVKLIRHFTKLK